MAASGSSERGPPAFPEDREPEAGHREPEDGDQEEASKVAHARVEVSSSGPAPCTTPSFPPAQHTSLEQLEEDEEAKDSFDVDISVTSPEKVADGMNAYVAYRVSTRVSLWN
uniref:Uncharacterized protein n=1 Tax=Knipowitschia caucasica TaxID=637954 RepID=A0AAV2LVH5_KNICA